VRPWLVFNCKFNLMEFTCTNQTNGCNQLGHSHTKNFNSTKIQKWNEWLTLSMNAPAMMRSRFGLTE
jgi:hypothetical protein